MNGIIHVRRLQSISIQHTGAQSGIVRRRARCLARYARRYEVVRVVRARYYAHLCVTRVDNLRYICYAGHQAVITRSRQRHM